MSVAMSMESVISSEGDEAMIRDTAKDESRGQDVALDRKVRIRVEEKS